jgi:hypothetical protein
MSLAPVRLLLLLSALLAGGLAWLWFDHAGAMRNVTWVAPAPLNPALGKVASAQPGAAVGNPTQYLAMLERPLFAPDRRPPPPPAPPMSRSAAFSRVQSPASLPGWTASCGVSRSMKPLGRGHSKASKAAMSPSPKAPRIANCAFSIPDWARLLCKPPHPTRLRRSCQRGSRLAT